ncbi:Abi-alpha family protein [Roseiarcaceae bacterium H3SJ34-1]|uniref:Abi-alpha family protein n=1 Tax=Terripilifer ovatus TaxID=3032367 RepID=UPI003AB971B8|nr:Abi-alpha family protein [Roseiarcaceae bacterium H3SJ34-1]
MDIFEALGKLIPVGKLYDDALSGPAKEVGKLGTDALKTARLILAPLQLVAAYQDRFERMCERIGKRVPEERRQEPPIEIAGPTLEKLRYVAEGSELSDMLEEVLTKAIDSDAQAAIHPSFSHIISMLSRDEAWMLYRLAKKSFTVVDHLELNRAEGRFQNRVIEESEFPYAELLLPDKVELFYAHLESMSLASWPVDKQDPVYAVQGGPQTGLRRHSRMELTEFGRLFVAACMPAEGFERHAKKT